MINDELDEYGKKKTWNNILLLAREC